MQWASLAQNVHQPRFCVLVLGARGVGSRAIKDDLLLYNAEQYQQR